MGMPPFPPAWVYLKQRGNNDDPKPPSVLGVLLVVLFTVVTFAGTIAWIHYTAQ